MNHLHRSLAAIFLGLTLFCCSPETPPAATNDQAAVADQADTLNKAWWKEAVVYQLYPRSFKDSDGDGVGDLRGIINKLDYLQALGIDVVWLNPVYESPNDDMGYDISNYREIMEEFGSMEDFDELLAGMHERDIKLVMDLVVNHTSDEHRWFRESRSSRDNPYRNYYHWWPAEKGTPPARYSFFDVNNDAWKYDTLTNAYYLHYFAVKQPDLNWENPKVREEVNDIMRYWLEKGIDGFRMDAFQYVSKDTTWPEFPKGYEKNIIQYYGMGPNLHQYLQDMNREVLSQYDIMTVAEGAGSTFEDAISLVAPERKELDMVYHFEGMDIGNSLEGYDLRDFKRVYTQWDSALAENGWLSIFLANHDVPRMVSKFGDDSPPFREPSSKLLTTFILSMRGTPYYYNGDELGMTNIRMSDISDYRDIAAINSYQKKKAEGEDLQAHMEYLKAFSRDNARTPFQWNDEPQAGFTSGTPWLKVNPNYTEINAEDQENDPNSVLNYFRKMIRFRKENPVLVYGDYRLLLPEDKQIYAYTRTLGGEKLFVLLNFSSDPATARLPDSLSLGQLKMNNLTTVPRTQDENRISLQPWQAVIYDLE